MGFIGDAVGSVVGGVEDAFGAKNNFNATAPVNDFQATAVPLQTTDYAGAINPAMAQAAGGAGPAAPTIAQMQALTAQLQAAANGVGPSVAQNQLREATNANVNNAASMAASARGINPALAARMSVDQAAQANQTSAASLATLRAQEQLAARQALAANLGQTATTQLGQQATGTQALSTAGQLQNQQNAAAIQNSLGTQGINASVAAGNQQAALGALGINAGVAGQNAGTGAKILGGVMSGVGSAMGLGGAGAGLGGGGASSAALPLGAVAIAHGGEVPPKPRTDKEIAAAAMEKLHPKKKDAPKGKKPTDKELAAQVVMQRFMGAAGHAAGGPIAPVAAPEPAPNAPRSMIGQAFAGPRMAKGGAAPVFMADGTVPGRAPIPEGVDSEKADQVPAWLSPGEIVIPRSIAQADDAPEQARDFVAHLMKTRGKSGYERVAAAKKRQEAA